MKLGSLYLENRYILAPMQNVTTGPYRRFCRKFHKIGLVSVPMLYTKRIEKNPEDISHDLCKIEEERPISVQLISSDPISLKKTIDYLESYKFDVLDINAGCPIAVNNSSKPVSLKIRTGFENSNNIKEFAKIANNSGIAFLTIHARTVKSFFENTSLNLDIVKKLKENLIIPLVGNGDIASPIAAKRFINYTNVDALMIGRESMGNPQIFNQIHEYFTTGKEVLFINDEKIMKKNIEIYKKCLDEFLNGITLPCNINEYKFTELKRNSIWLARNIKNSAIIRRQISNTKNLEQLELVLNNM